MLTTVTTTTVTTVSLTSAGSLAAIAIVTGLVMALNKEMLLASQRPWAVRLGTALNVAIVPLLIVFAASAIVRIGGVVG